MGTNLENRHHKFLDLKVKSVLLRENSSWVKQILQRPTSEYLQNQNNFRHWPNYAC